MDEDIRTLERDAPSDPLARARLQSAVARGGGVSYALTPQV